jgi:sugar phosphate isomerase/epimerase
MGTHGEVIRAMTTDQPARRRLPVALQLYTLREQMKDDFRGVVRAVAGMGYDGVQFAGYGGLSAPEMRTLLDDNGVRPAGTHTGLDTLEGDLEAELDYNQAIGNRWVICPAIPEARRRDLAGWRDVAASLNRVGERCVARGLLFGYHNHSFEFPPIPDGEGRRGLDVILGETDPRHVFWEPDVYWIKKGGADPAAMIREYAGRVPITHLKDMTGDERATFAEVGEGTLDWPAILDASDAAAVEWHCVEQDRCDRPPLESVRLSLEHLRSWGMGDGR